MARNAGIADQAAGILRQRPHGATLSEIRAALKKRGRGDVLPHSLRAAIYQTILLASPIWNIRAPMIMSTFTESHDFSGKSVFPVTTHTMSGLGTTPEDYARECIGARVGPGIAVRGEEVRCAGPAIDAWLRRTGLLDLRVRAHD